MDLSALSTDPLLGGLNCQRPEFADDDYYRDFLSPFELMDERLDISSLMDDFNVNPNQFMNLSPESSNGTDNTANVGSSSGGSSPLHSPTTSGGSQPSDASDHSPHSSICEELLPNDCVSTLDAVRRSAPASTAPAVSRESARPVFETNRPTRQPLPPRREPRKRHNFTSQPQPAQAQNARQTVHSPDGVFIARQETVNLWNVKEESMDAFCNGAGTSEYDFGLEPGTVYEVAELPANFVGSENVVWVTVPENAAGVAQPNVAPLTVAQPLVGGHVNSNAANGFCTLVPLSSLQPAPPTPTFPSIKPKMSAKVVKNEAASACPSFSGSMDSEVTVIPCPPVVVAQTPAPTVDAQPANESSGPAKLFAMKREQRKIRNREAAQQSRLRRKEYVDSLQTQLETVQKNFDRVKRENVQLRDTIAQLKAENTKLKQERPSVVDRNSQMTSGAPPSRVHQFAAQRGVVSGGKAINGAPRHVAGGMGLLSKSTALCLSVMMTLFVLNFSSYLNFAPGSLTEPAPVSKYGLDARFQSRSLMQYDDPVEKSNSRSKRDASLETEPRLASFNETLSAEDCQKLYDVNETESRRLADELSRWMSLYEKFKSKISPLDDSILAKLPKPPYHSLLRQKAAGRMMRKEHPNNNNVKVEKKQQQLKKKGRQRGRGLAQLVGAEDRGPLELMRDFVGPLTWWADQIKENRRNTAQGNEANKVSEGAKQDFGLEPYHSPEFRYFQLLQDSLQRRDDTFYLVSFRKDYLLLPATARNGTSRPRMSLVVPILTLNDSQFRDGRKPDHVAMMQIDSEVMATRLLHFPHQLLNPLSGFRTRENKGKDRGDARDATTSGNGTESRRKPDRRNSSSEST